MIQNAKKQILSLTKPCLLGLSGGPDSMCLAALLLECRKSFHIAHIDHGLRAESAREKEQLENFARDHEIPFHSITLAKTPMGNLEETLREKRLAFFKKVMTEHNLEVLLLGHQEDEQAETIIKRFFEGGSFLHLQGMKQEAEVQEISIFRPLLHTSKSDVIEYLDKQAIFYFVDPSNFTTGNLRGKMRVNLIPTLEEEFGKSIRSSVCDIGDQMEDLGLYLDEQIDLLKEDACAGFCGTLYPYKGKDAYIFRMMIQKALNEQGVVLSRNDREILKRGIEARVAGKQRVFGAKTLFFEDVGVFIINTKNYRVPFAYIKDVSWESFWKGEGETEKVGQPLLDRKEVSEYHRLRKTPICLRKVYPIPLTTNPKKIKIETP